MSITPPPAPPEVTPDGKFFWDGTHWAPLQKSVEDSPPASGHGWGKTAAVAIVALFVGGFVGFAIGSGSHASPSGGTVSDLGSSPVTSAQTSTAPQAPAVAPVTVTGQGDTKTALFTLAGGNYTVSYDFSGPCFYGAFLDQPPSTESDLASATGPIKGTTQAYNVHAGSYYIHMISGAAPACPWTLTFVKN